MIAKEKALEALSKYEEKYRPSYSLIDPLIKPLCDLLTNNEYITMHSCSSHVKVKSYKAEMIAGNPSLMTPNERKQWIHSRYKYWYVLFVATVPIADIQKVIKIINAKYDYELNCKKVNSHAGITRRWSMYSHYVKDSFTNDDIYEFNKNIYLEFKNYFDNK